MVSIQKAGALASSVSNNHYGIIPTSVAQDRLKSFCDIGWKSVLPDVTVHTCKDAKQLYNNYDVQLEMSYVQQPS